MFGTLSSLPPWLRPDARRAATAFASAAAAMTFLSGSMPQTPTAAAQHPARHAAGTPRHGGGSKAGTYLIYDSTTPTVLPRRHAAAVYANGAYRPSSAQVPRSKVVLWIDTDASNPSADVLDVEPGDASPSSVAKWVRSRLSRHSWSTPIIYTMRSEWNAAKASARTLPRRSQVRVRWWIADPTGHPHLVRGSSATQWYWGDSYDTSTARSDLTTLTH